VKLNFYSFPLQELSSEELRERCELVRRLKSELKNEEMALVLLKKLKQSQQLPVAREATNSSAAAAATTSLGGGATLTATRLTGGKTAADGRPLQRQTSANAAANDLLNTDKLVSLSGWSTGSMFLIFR
jgi:hypothetical protein